MEDLHSNEFEYARELVTRTGKSGVLHSHGVAKSWMRISNWTDWLGTIKPGEKDWQSKPWFIALTVDQWLASISVFVNICHDNNVVSQTPFSVNYRNHNSVIIMRDIFQLFWKKETILYSTASWLSIFFLVSEYISTLK